MTSNNKHKQMRLKSCYTRLAYASALLMFVRADARQIKDVATNYNLFHCSSIQSNRQKHVSSFCMHRSHSHRIQSGRFRGRIKPAVSFMAKNSDGSNKNASNNSDSTIKWQAGNFQNDYKILKDAIARQSAMTNLQQQHRRYILDYGFARNRRPLIQDLIKAICIIGGWTAFFVTGYASNHWYHHVKTWKYMSWMSMLHVSMTQLLVNLSSLHHWVVGMITPLCMLAWAKSERSPSARTLEEYFKPNMNAPKFFYTSDSVKKKSRDKDVGDYVLCLAENWSSAIFPTFALGLCSCLLRCSNRARGACFIDTNIEKMRSSLFLLMPVLARLLTRLGAAASLHQYPSLLFELRRNDQPRPLCRSTAYMQRIVAMFLRWLPICVASDLAIIIGTILQTRNISGIGGVSLGIATISLLSVVAPISHLIALVRILRITKCSAMSLSKSTSFNDPSHDQYVETETVDEKRQQVRWRYQFRWRTPKRISETLKSWTNYFLTGHTPLLNLNDWKEQPLRFDDFITEGSYSLFNDRGRANSTDTSQDNGLISYADSITESLSLIFRDRDAAIQNATQARYNKHQESYDAKTLDDVLGIAVQQTFGIGLSYDFEHFDVPGSSNISIHQMRARMAKSAVRRKRELDRKMNEELDVLERLKKNVVTPKTKDIAEDETRVVEDEIRNRNLDEVEFMKAAMLRMIPTNAVAPAGTDLNDSPIIVAEYVNLTAPVNRQFTATVESAPDSLSMIEEYVRKDFGDEAADAYRQQEIAFRKKERKMTEHIRRNRDQSKNNHKS